MDEDNRFPLSLISQYGYCPRRAGLIMNEQVWLENAETASGRAQHERVHDCRIEKRGTIVKLYEHQVYSAELGITGKCDCIEATESDQGCVIPFLHKSYCLYPIEYKHGTIRDEWEYQLQLCAQAICLEWMYNTSISEGAIFFINAHRRDIVEFTYELRQDVVETADAIQKLRESLTIPLPTYGSKCLKCSLYDYCLPKTSTTAKKYCNNLFDEAMRKQEK